MSDNAFNNQSPITTVSFGKDCSYVGERAFESCTSLMTINVDNVIETIGEMAFSNTNLKSVTFNKLTELGSSAFKECKNLSSISIPNCNKIPNSAFSSCEKLNNIDLYNCIEIGNNAFQGCIDLDTLELNECKTIGEHAFNGCKKISEVTLNACESIGADAFLNCPNLTKVYINDISDSSDSDSDDVEICKLGNPEAFFINVSETDIPKYEINPNLFFYVKSNVIDKYKADANWKTYESQMVSTVDYNQIQYTSTYSPVEGNITLPAITTTYKDAIEKHTYDKGKGFIQFKEKITTLHKIFEDPTHITSIDIPSECESIEDYAFEGYTSLTDIRLSNTLTKIGEYAFKNCKSFTSFKIPQTVTELGEGIFAGCENIKKFEGKFTVYNNKTIVYDKKLIAVVPIDNGVLGGSIYDTYVIDRNISHLGKSCFSGCKKLRRVNINANILNVGENAFEGCENLRDVHFYTNNNGLRIQNIDGNVFGEIEKIRSDFKIFVPEASFQKYNNNMQYYTNYIYPTPINKDIIYYSEEKIGGSPVANGNYPNGKYYKIQNSSTILTYNIFRSTNVKKVILAENYTHINDNAFNNCKQLEYVYIPDSLTLFGQGCFNGCESLTSIHIPSGLNNILTSIGSSISPVLKFKKNIFYGCTNLKEFGTYIKGLTIDDDKCYIEGNTLKFFAQGSLIKEGDGKKYTIPENIKTIDSFVFNGVDISNINLSNVETIGSYAFSECTMLKTINLENVTSIGGYAFSECSKLQEVAVTEKLSSIKECAFKDCNSLYIFELPETLKTIGDSAFENCHKYSFNSNINDNYIFKLPKYIESIGKNCFKKTIINLLYIKDCPNLKTIPEGAFCKTPLTHIFLETNNITTIGKGAFEGCGELRNIWTSLEREINKLTDSIEHISDDAFKNTDIEIIKLPSNLKTLGNNCLNSATSIHMPSNTKSLPTFTKESSYPFDINKVGIDIPNKFEKEIKDNKYWSKYINNIYIY